MPPQIENQIPKKHTQLVLLAIVMILVGILAVGYFVYQNQQIVAPGTNDPIIKQNQNITVATTTDDNN